MFMAVVYYSEGYGAKSAEGKGTWERLEENLVQISWGPLPVGHSGWMYFLLQQAVNCCLPGRLIGLSAQGFLEDRSHRHPPPGPYSNSRLLEGKQASAWITLWHAQFRYGEPFLRENDGNSPKSHPPRYQLRATFARRPSAPVFWFFSVQYLLKGDWSLLYGI